MLDFPKVLISGHFFFYSYWNLHESCSDSHIESLCLQPDTVTGNIVFVLQLKEHPKFKRKFDDLYVEHTLSLTEALCGFEFALTHLDGRQLLIKSDPGEVIKPGMGIIYLSAVGKYNASVASLLIILVRCIWTWTIHMLDLVAMVPMLNCGSHREILPAWIS